MQSPSQPSQPAPKTPTAPPRQAAAPPAPGSVSSASSSASPAASSASRLGPSGRYIWQGKVLPAFWTIASVLSLTVNLILIIVLLILGRELFAIKSLVGGLINGLHTNFVAMDNATIRAVIPVEEMIPFNSTMPVIFDLPLHQQTEVILNRDTPVPGATVFLNGSPVRTDIVLRQGTRLNINLDLTVPVSQTIPVALQVPVKLNVQVDIPLNQTELHQPFVGLREVIEPYKLLLDGLPNSWYETPFCGVWTGWMCSLLFGAK